MLTWIDIETTGLDHNLDHILEIAVVLTGDRLERIAERSYLVKPPSQALLLAMPEKVREMHTASHLIDDVMSRGMPLATVQDDLIGWYIEVTAGGKFPMCGSTIGFDRRFLMRWMPDFEALFHYRSIDISSIKELVSRWTPERTWPGTAGNKQHRGLADLDHTLEEAKWYYDHIFFTEG